MLWIKALHVAFMVAWFAGLFYLPRVFVNHAMAKETAVIERLELMERKLYHFITPWMALTVLFGLWLLVDYGWIAFSGMLWLHIKLVLVMVLIGYHFYCGKLMQDLAKRRCTKSHIWFRWFNELPVVILFTIVVLVVVKPF